MIKVVARQTVKEGMNERFEEVGREIVAASRVEEGNIDYSLNRSTNDPSVYCYIEVWESKEHLDAHMKAEHFVRLAPQIGDMVQEGSVQMDIYTVL